MKTKQFFEALLLCMGVVACATEEAAQDQEYVIVAKVPKPPDNKYFQAIDIHSGKSTPVYSIKETGGRLYVPTMSSLPECNKKVVAGHFLEDTIFVTTKVLRDTTVPTVGR